MQQLAGDVRALVGNSKVKQDTVDQWSTERKCADVWGSAQLDDAAAAVGWSGVGRAADE
jgi:hypothetical protein